MSLEPAPPLPTDKDKSPPQKSFFLDTYKYFKNLPHQQQAIAYLESQLSAEVKEEFARKWREAPPVVPATVPKEKPQPAPAQPKTLVEKIVAYMKMKGYKLEGAEGKRNIVYVEGMNVDGTLNDDRPNWFNDIRCVFEFINGQPKMLGIWSATTEPGRFYTQQPLNPSGCARIQFGQYRAWQVGYHGTRQVHEALVQRGSVTVCRDLNKDFKRIGDKLHTGSDFCINQHWGGDSPVEDIGRWSAGCLVGRTMDGHREFMKIVKEDPDYKKNPAYMFATTVIAGDDLVKVISG